MEVYPDARINVSMSGLKCQIAGSELPLALAIVTRLTVPVDEAGNVASSDVLARTGMFERGELGVPHEAGEPTGVVLSHSNERQTGNVPDSLQTASKSLVNVAGLNISTAGMAVHFCAIQRYSGTPQQLASVRHAAPASTQA